MWERDLLGPAQKVRGKGKRRGVHWPGVSLLSGLFGQVDH